jgi:hypothetical protein
MIKLKIETLKIINMKFSLKSLFIIIILFAINVDMDAQRKRKRVRPSDRVEEEESSEPKMSFTDNLNYEIKIGNLGFSNDFVISLKPSVGYKFHKYGSAGVGSRIFYATGVRNGTQVTAFDYGFYGYGRVRLNHNFYLQGEYTTYSIDNGTRENITYPLVGAGYVTSIGGGPWSSGIEILFIADSDARIDTESTVEWWFSFSYNF